MRYRGWAHAAFILSASVVAYATPAAAQYTPNWPDLAVPAVSLAAPELPSPPQQSALENFRLQLEAYRDGCEKYRRGLEKFRRKVERCRVEIESKRRTGDINEADYASLIEAYVSKLEAYEEGCEQYDEAVVNYSTRFASYRQQRTGFQGI